MDSWSTEIERRQLEYVHVGPVALRQGDRVRLEPSQRADILDIALRGKLATIESIEEDFDGRMYVAVTIDDDPGRDLGALHQPGHRFFFQLQEVKPLRDLPGDAP